MYVESVTSPEDRKLGVFTLMELHRKGTEFVGKGRHNTVYWKTYPNSSEKIVTKNCLLEQSIVLTLVSPSRIEGRAFGPPDDATQDRDTCKWSHEFVWSEFTWIPQ
jgi:hypothetical protein